MSTSNLPAMDAPSKSSVNLADYWEQRLSATPTLAGVGHNGFGLAFNEWMYKLRKLVFLRHVRSLHRDFAKASVLDIGSGTGFWLRTWQSLGVKDLTGSDITAVATRNITAAIPGIHMLQLDITSPSATATLGPVRRYLCHRHALSHRFR